MTEPLSDTDDILLAEYALGTLDYEDRVVLETRLAQEPDLRAALALWDARLVPLAEEYDPVPPPAGLKRAVDARVFGRPAERMDTLALSTIEAARKAARMWRGLAGAGFALAVGLAAALFLTDTRGPDPTPQVGPDLIAEIAAEDRSVQVLAVFDPETSALRLVRTSGAAPTGRVLQLWAIVGTAPPVSLGLLPETEVAVLPVAPDLLGAGATLAISTEPPGGSPTGAPTGDVVAAGALQAL